MFVYLKSLCIADTTRRHFVFTLNAWVRMGCNFTHRHINLSFCQNFSFLAM